jgi:hypothetical protein
MSHPPYLEEPDPRPVNMKNVQIPQIPQEENVKYFALHLVRRLAWGKHIFAEGQLLGMPLTEMYWLLGRKSELSTSNTFIMHKAILKPVWT